MTDLAAIRARHKSAELSTREQLWADVEQTLALVDKQAAEIERLRDAMLWIDTYDPETIAAAETKFGFKVNGYD